MNQDFIFDVHLYIVCFSLKMKFYIVFVPDKPDMG